MKKGKMMNVTYKCLRKVKQILKFVKVLDLTLIIFTRSGISF